MGRLKELLKRAGKGIVVTAASVLAGATLGPLAATAVGGFLSRTMSEIGMAVSEEVVGEVVKDYIEDAPDRLMELGTPQRMEEVAGDLAERTGAEKEDVQAALQYSLRELQGTMSFVIHELREDKALLAEVLVLARETDAKVDTLIDRSEKTQEALQDVLTRLDSMERGLDISYRKFIGKYSDPTKLTYERLKVISKLQRQRTIVVSGFGIRYNPDLYVVRQKEESFFGKFMGDVGMSDRNVFLVLGNVGLGKTWFLTRMSELSMEMGSPTFFVPLSHGIKSLTSVFQVETIPALVDLIDPILDEAGEHAFVLLDGLDEMDPRSIRHVLGALATARSNSVSFVISCRAADWTSNRAIVLGSNELKYFIYENSEAAAAARAMRVNTPVSVLMKEFTEQEMKAAMTRYQLPSEVPADLLPLLDKPYVMRLSSQWFNLFGTLPSPSSPEFLDLFAGGPRYADSIFRRLGILTERDSLYATVEALIEAQAESMLVGQLPLETESTTFQTLVSSGLLQIRFDRSGTVVSLSPEFIVPLFSLAILRYQTNREKLEDMLSHVAQWIPDKAKVISKIVIQACDGITPPVVPETPAVTPSDTETPVEPEVVTTDPIPKKGLVQSFTPPAETSDEPVIPLPTLIGIPTSLHGAVETLWALLDDSDVRVRRASSMGLGLVSAQLKDITGGVELLTPLLENADPDHRTGTFWGLSLLAATMKDPTKRMELLMPSIEDWEWAIRRNAAFGICLAACKIDDVNSRLEVIQPLLQHDDGQIRAGAAEGLGLGSMSLSDPTDMVNHLAPLLEDSFDDVRGGGAFGLGMVAAMLSNPDESLATLTHLATDGYGTVRNGAIIGMSLVATRHIDPSDIIGTLTSLLDDQTVNVRATASLGLGLAAAGLQKPSEVIPILAKPLEDSQEDVRKAAALGMGLASTRLQTHEEMVATLKPLTEGDEQLRGGAAIGLGMAGTRFWDPTETIALITPMLHDSERSVRKAAVLGMSLASTKYKSVEDKLGAISAHVQSEDEIVRRGAALGLGVCSTEVNLSEGVVIGESFWGHLPLEYDECIVAGMASSMLLRFGR